ncbi:aspartyl-tRNA(Asn)/glutamyl-tRNA(Gln) amidotransferase subunit A [Chromobacterium alkanivorans]|uniref:amidase n=1 Tax=Chromobacterium alkanivorans TaxID=1071719 RepID=UPI00216A7DDD|nr:amidase [Chromobacterium alkanivorans]MCS3803929.1 aspartyl-tRNA(Asn)/glutamyl-tRNA(Gln) amidotransferase subunit A [Chromobacterium alkanivorans]MCS3817966.1 aspartyl-tRNA(Asn)/glutamyl-tRNA(Gln) amidotransferase subunit A [Chromobacterium alkanivorans]MCS3875586.1 aspartyl-tRNA(Asn)/glutamyl-tRNA(Gln) amidotransferase subunit A [Chromobacterium alkanivorans]
MNPTLMQLHQALRQGRTSSVALTERALDAIRRHQEGGGVAFIQVDAEAALAAARGIDAAKRYPSPLSGIPLSVKDLFDVQGQVTTAGSLALKTEPPAAQDATAVARLRAAGAVLLGRTNMSEFAYSGLGLNPHYGTPLNPADPERIAGGSSSGAAVGVALGLSAAALGTDTGGSLRIPAAFCGLTGFKPTARHVPQQGCLPLSPSLDSIGALGRSVSCCTILDAVLRKGRIPALAQNEAPLLGKHRLYVTEDYVADQLDPAVAQAFAQALSRLSNAGAKIVRFDFPELRQIADINAKGGIVAAEAWRWHQERLQGENGHAYDPRIARRIRAGASQSIAEYLDTLERRRALQAAATRRLSMADAWLMPTVAIRPPKLAELVDDDAFTRANSLVLRNTSIVNLLDGCALSLPLTPQIGLSVCGLFGRDNHILKLAAGIERALANT